VAGLHEIAGRILAQHREAGTAEAEHARDLVARHLRALGYRVTSQQFRFHPSALLGLPILGAGLGAAALLALPLLALPGVPGWGALAVWSLLLAATAGLSIGVAAGWVTLGDAREDANLVAVRGEAAPRRWIVAHLDTKAQAQSMAGRLVAVWALVLAVACGTGLALARLLTPLPLWMAAAGAALAVIAGALAGRGRLRGTSRGARDNGSGVVAALAFAEVSDDVGTGILITGAEEFGLVGARMFARVRGSLDGMTVVNLDTIDADGMLFVVRHHARARGVAEAVVRRLEPLGLGVRSRRLPLGILVDSLPLARAGAEAVTVGRLTWNTLRIIHTPADVPETLSLEPAERVGRALAMN
jgi:Peptidase family M28